MYLLPYPGGEHTVLTANAVGSAITGIPLTGGVASIPVTVTDALIPAEVLEAIDTKTTGLVTVTGAGIAGNYTDVNVLLDAAALATPTIAALVFVSP